MFKMLKRAKAAQQRAEESIERSDAAAADYHASINKNVEAHEDLMKELDRRHRPRHAV